MRPAHTTIRLAHSTKDYTACHGLLTDLGMPEPRLAWPTVTAWRNEELAGCLATRPHAQAIIAGPLAVRVKQPAILAMRLVEGYETVLRHAGVQSYYFGIDATQAAWQQALAKLGLTPYYRDTGSAWYKRDLFKAEKDALVKEDT